MDCDDVKLIERARMGDRAALTDLLKRYMPLVRACTDATISAAARVVVSPEDVFQDVQIGAFLAIEDFDSTNASQFSAWIREITRTTVLDINRHFDALKRGGGCGRDGRSFEALSVELLHDMRFPSRKQSSPSRHLRLQEAMDLLDRLIELLPAKHRQMMRLHLAGAEPEAVASELGISLGSVYAGLCRARRELRLGIQAHISQFESFL